MNAHRSTAPTALFLTALDLEYAAVEAQLTEVHAGPRVSGTRFDVGTLPGRIGNAVLCLTGMGNNSSGVLAERAIQHFKPKAVFFVGVAGALKKSLPLGAVVVATHVYAYHGAAARVDGPKSRPRVWDIDHGMEQAAHYVNRRYERERGSAGGPILHFGPVASGEVLLDDPESETRRWIREHYEDALAIEMEAAGVAKAGQLNVAPIAVVRAISDYADGSKSVSDGADWQRRAVANAARAAVDIAVELFDGLESELDAEEHDRLAPSMTVLGGSHGAVGGVINGGVHNTYSRDGRGA